MLNFNIQFLSCSGKDLDKVMYCDNPLNIADIITASGFPRIQILRIIRIWHTNAALYMK